MADLLGMSIGVEEPLMEAGLDSIGASLLASRSGQKKCLGVSGSASMVNVPYFLQQDATSVRAV